MGRLASYSRTMTMAELRERVRRLLLRESLEDIEQERLEAMELLDAKAAELQAMVVALQQRQEEWDVKLADRRARARTDKQRAAIDKLQRPAETEKFETLRQQIERLRRELGELPDSDEFPQRKRPAKTDVNYPSGETFKFPAFHEWLPLPPLPAGQSHRSKGPGEDEFNAMTGSKRAEGGLFDAAMPGGKSAELKAPGNNNVFRGGATARKQASKVRRRIERIIDQVGDLLQRAGDLPANQLKKIRYAHHLLNNVDESLMGGNLMKADLQELYSALEHLKEVDLSGVKGPKDDPIIGADPAQLFRFIEETMNADQSFFTDYIILVRPMQGPSEYLAIPKEDFSKRIRFLQMSKGDAYFRYV